MSAQIILASTSPRRSELLKQIGIYHRIQVVEIDETPMPGEAALDYVLRVAAEKSAATLAFLNPELPVLSADTSVVCDAEIMGKPENREHALEMLSRLSGRTHQVYTAVSLRGARHDTVVSVTDVRFRKLSQAELSDYWDSGEPCDKAGAYAIQGLGSIFIESITGSFSGVMGLPLFETAQLLAQQGIKVIT